MEDLQIIRRERATKGQYLSNEKPLIKIEMARGTFVIFKKVADLLKATKDDAVMFAFSRKNNCAYIYKEEAEDDNYHLGNSGRAYYRFTSKNLLSYFIHFFRLKNEKTVYFEVLPTPNEKGMFKVIIL